MSSLTHPGQILGFHNFQQGVGNRLVAQGQEEGSEACVSPRSDKGDSSPREWLANALGVQDPAQLTVSFLHLWA